MMPLKIKMFFFVFLFTNPGKNRTGIVLSILNSYFVKRLKSLYISFVYSMYIVWTYCKDNKMEYLLLCIFCPIVTEKSKQFWKAFTKILMYLIRRKLQGLIIEITQYFLLVIKIPYLSYPPWWACEGRWAGHPATSDGRWFER